MNDSPVVRVFDTRGEMGSAAALAVQQEMLRLLAVQQMVRMVFAAAPSQLEFLASLVSLKAIPWQRVEGFHMDEYLGIQPHVPQSFGQFLREHLFDLVEFGRVEFIDPHPPDPAAECRRYSELLHERVIDIVCLGIGENGHIAFNDPPVADFCDPLSVKVVELEVRCRLQQVNDGAFTRVEDVPRHAITLTIPQLLSAQSLFTIVPGPRKAGAVFEALRGPISTSCPASGLRTHGHVEIFLDRDSASLLR